MGSSLMMVFTLESATPSYFCRPSDPANPESGREGEGEKSGGEEGEREGGIGVGLGLRYQILSHDERAPRFVREQRANRTLFR